MVPPDNIKLYVNTFELTIQHNPWMRQVECSWTLQRLKGGCIIINHVLLACTESLSTVFRKLTYFVWGEKSISATFGTSLSKSTNKREVMRLLDRSVLSVSVLSNFTSRVNRSTEVSFYKQKWPFLFKNNRSVLFQIFMAQKCPFPKMNRTKIMHRVPF